MKKSRYGDYYKKTTILNETNGSVRDEYIYTGDYYHFTQTKKQIKHQKAFILIIAVFSFTLYGICGFIDTGGSRMFYVLLPFVAAFLPLAFMAIAAFQLVFKRSDYTVFDYERIWIRLRTTAIATICLLSLSISGEMVFLITSTGRISILKEVSFLLCCGAIALLSVILLRIHAKMTCSAVDADSKH